MMLQIVRNWQILASALRGAAASSRGKDSPKCEIIFSWIIEKEGWFWLNSNFFCVEGLQSDLEETVFQTVLIEEIGFLEN